MKSLLEIIEARKYIVDSEKIMFREIHDYPWFVLSPMDPNHSKVYRALIKLEAGTIMLFALKVKRSYAV